MKKIILFTFCLLVSSYVSPTYAKQKVKLPSNAHILKIIKLELLHDIVSSDIVGFEKANGGGDVYCSDIAVQRIKIVKKGRPGAIINIYYDEYLYSVFDVYFKVSGGSCKLSKPAKVQEDDHRKTVIGRVPFLKGTYHVTLKSLNGVSNWHVGPQSKVWPPQMSDAEEARYRLNYYNSHGKGLEHDYGLDEYGKRDYDKPIITTPRTRLISAVREHPNSKEVKILLAIIDRNSSLRKTMESLLSPSKQQRLGRSILYGIKGIKDRKRQDQISLEIIKEFKNGILSSRSNRKRAANVSSARQGSPFKVSKRIKGKLTQDDFAHKKCVSEFGSGYRLASWKDVVKYYTSSRVEEIKTYTSRYYISFAGKELSKSKKLRHHFFFERNHTPRHAMTNGSTMSTLCIKRSAVLKTTSSAPSSATPFRVTKLTNIVRGQKNTANNACVSEFGSSFRVARWTELSKYYASPTKAALNTFKNNKYLISSSGKEVGPNKDHRYAFQLKNSRPRKRLTSAAKAQSLCINKKSPAVKKLRQKTLHIHGSRPHDHKLPRQGAAHRHGNGAIGR